MSVIGKKKTIKNTNIWRLNNMLLNNQQIMEEIKKEIKICIETNENENMTSQNLWDVVKAVLRGRLIAIQAYLQKQEKHQTSSYLKQLEKEEMKNPKIQFSSVAQLCPTLCDPMNHCTPSLPVHHQLPESTQTHVHWVGDAIQQSHPLSSPSSPALNLPQVRVFSNESALCIRWPKYWSFSFNISPSNEYSGLISFRMDWLDLLAVQGTSKSLLQHHGSKGSILQRSSFFIVQLSHPYMTTGKTIAWTRRTFVDKVMSLLFNVLSRFVITFLPRSKHLLNSWLQ